MSAVLYDGLTAAGLEKVLFFCGSSVLFTFI
jgi:hypothetical protein